MSGTRPPSVIINTPSALHDVRIPQRKSSQGPHRHCEHQSRFDTVSHPAAAVASFAFPSPRRRITPPPRPRFRPVSRPCLPASLILYCLQLGYTSRPGLHLVDALLDNPTALPAHWLYRAFSALARAFQRPHEHFLKTGSGVGGVHFGCESAIMIPYGQVRSPRRAELCCCS